MDVLVTGATGLIGHAVARRLLAEGHSVRALVRRADARLPEGVRPVPGDILDAGSLAEATDGAELVFHAAGMPEQWQRDESIFDRVNRGGTANVLAAARDASVRRVVYTSTMDVFAAPRGGTLVEGELDPAPKHTAYERSKQAAEREVDAARAQGLDVVTIHPAAVYGPSPVNVTLNDFFIRLLRGKVPMLPPGGMSVAYVDGVADAHVAAAARAPANARYLVADEHVSTVELATLIAREAGLAKVPRPGAAWLLRAIAAVSAPLARVFGFTPLVAPGQLTFLLWDARVDASRAQRELGFRPTPVAEGVARTVAFLRAEHLV